MADAVRAAAKRKGAKKPEKKPATKSSPAPRARRGKAAAKRPPWRPPEDLAALQQGHLLFVSAFVASELKDPVGAWLRASGAPQGEHTQEYVEWLLNQPLIREEIRLALVPLMSDDDVDRSWVATQLYHLSQGNIFDYVVFREVEEPLIDGEGNWIMDQDGQPVSRPVQRLQLRSDLMDLPPHLQRNVRKLKIKRMADGDQVELEIYDRQRAVMDIAKLSGLEGKEKIEKVGRTFAERVREAAARQEAMNAKRLAGR